MHQKVVHIKFTKTLACIWSLLEAWDVHTSLTFPIARLSTEKTSVSVQCSLRALVLFCPAAHMSPFMLLLFWCSQSRHGWPDLPHTPAGLCRLHWLEHRLDPHRNRPEKAPGHHFPGGTSKKRHLDCGHKGWDMGASPGTEAGTTPCSIAAPWQIQGDLCRFPFIPCLTAPTMLSGSTSFLFTAVNILFMSFVCQQSCAASLRPSLLEWCVSVKCCTREEKSLWHFSWGSEPTDE